MLDHERSLRVLSRGVELHAREILGQPYQEYRVSGATALPVEEIDKRFIERFLTVKDESIERTVIEKNNESIIIYDKVKTPVTARGCSSAENKDPSWSTQFTRTQVAPFLPGWFRPRRKRKR